MMDGDPGVDVDVTGHNSGGGWYSPEFAHRPKLVFVCGMTLFALVLLTITVVTGAKLFMYVMSLHAGSTAPSLLAILAKSAAFGGPAALCYLTSRFTTRIMVRHVKNRSGH